MDEIFKWVWQCLVGFNRKLYDKYDIVINEYNVIQTGTSLTALILQYNNLNENMKAVFAHGKINA